MNSDGFSIKELIALALLLTVIVIGARPLFVYLKNQANESKTKTNLAAVRSAVDIFYAHRLFYPADLFTDLTANDEFLPPVGGVHSLGRFLIPPNDQNPGHNGPLYQNASQSEAVTYGNFTDKTPLFYDLQVSENGESQNPKVSINCIHPTKTGRVWKNL